MLELLAAIALTVWLPIIMILCFVGGMAALMEYIRRNDADLYFDWMDRLEARREARKERK